MELLYLWIEDYKNIHHQGFNFSPKYRFEFTPEFEDKTKKEKVIGGELFQLDGNGHRISKGNLDSMQENPIYENFFEPSQKVKDAWKERKDGLGSPIHLGTITNITGIIGANGAGKSNLLDFIRYQRRLVWNNSSIPTGCITIIRIGETNFISKSKDWKIYHPNSVVESTEARYKPEDIPLYIYYSNILNMQKEDKLNVNLSNLILLSTDFLCSQTEMNFNRIKSWELEYKILFILFSKFEKFVLPLELPITPKKILLSLEVEKKPKFISLDGNRMYSQETESSLAEIYTESMNLWSTNHAENLSLMMKIFLIQILVRKYPNLSPNANEKSQELNTILAFKGTDFHKKVEIFLEKFISYDQTQTLFIKNYKKLIDKMLEVSNSKNSNLFSFIEYIESIPDNTQKIKIEIDEVLLGEFFSLLHKIGWTVFNFSWPNQRPSTGEDSLLTLFSRFFSTIMKTNDPKFITINEVITDNLLILIDEGEVGFHPEWQRKYLKYLIDFFPQIYPGKQIQIILTTHSPFLASDLPKENIIFLKKGEEGEIIQSDKSDGEGKCVVVDGLKREKTFGANIHTLLSDGFFLNEGLIGEFAKGKINEVIRTMEPLLKYPKEKRDLEYESRILEKEKDKKLKQTEIEHLDKEYESQKEKFNKEKERIKKIIDAIGEPIVQDKLLQMYYTIESKDAKEAQIKFHKEKIRKLEENDSNKNS